MILEFTCICLVNARSYFDTYFNLASFYLERKLNYSPKKNVVKAIPSVYIYIEREKGDFPFPQKSNKQNYKGNMDNRKGWHN